MDLLLLLRTKGTVVLGFGVLGFGHALNPNPKPHEALKSSL